MLIVYVTVVTLLLVRAVPKMAAYLASGSRR